MPMNFPCAGKMAPESSQQDRENIILSRTPGQKPIAKPSSSKKFLPRHPITRFLPNAISPSPAFFSEADTLPKGCPHETSGSASRQRPLQRVASATRGAAAPQVGRSFLWPRCHHRFSALSAFPSIRRPRREEPDATLHGAKAPELHHVLGQGLSQPSPLGGFL